MPHFIHPGSNIYARALCMKTGTVIVCIIMCQHSTSWFDLRKVLINIHEVSFVLSVIKLHLMLNETAPKMLANKQIYFSQ